MVSAVSGEGLQTLLASVQTMLGQSVDVERWDDADTTPGGGFGGEDLAGIEETSAPSTAGDDESDEYDDEPRITKD